MHSGIRTRRGPPPKKLAFSYDMTADATFAMAGRLIQEAQSMDYEARLKTLQVCMPLALKRIPDKVESTNLVLNISDTDAQAMLAEARRNLLIYKELREQRETSDNPNVGIPPPL